MLVHVLIRCLPQRVERCHLNVEVSMFESSVFVSQSFRIVRPQLGVKSSPRTPAAASGAGLGGAQPPADWFKPWWERIPKVHGISRA